jgi:hypothetical protein
MIEPARGTRHFGAGVGVGLGAGRAWAHDPGVGDEGVRVEPVVLDRPHSDQRGRPAEAGLAVHSHGAVPAGRHRVCLELQLAPQSDDMIIS